MLNNAHGGLDSFKEMVNFAIFPSAGLHSLGFLPSCVGEWTLLELLLSHSRCPEPRQNARRSFYIATSTITIYAPSLFPSATVATKEGKNVFFCFFVFF